MTTRIARAVVCLALPVAAIAPCRALETDQFYTWGRPMADSTDAVNAWVNLEISAALEEVNRGKGSRDRTCERVAKSVMWNMRFFIFHEIEMWALNSPLVDRIPSTPEEELEYREVNLYHNHGPLDIGTSIPTSPTIEMNGVRFGTDKLSHFISSGWRYYNRYRRALKKGLSVEEAERRAIRKGIFYERTILGRMSSGVFSVADLEANYSGMHFFIDLCDGDPPILAPSEDGWTIGRPIDLRDYVVPEWDESYQPSGYSRGRWRKVRPVLIRYCPLLETPEYIERMSRYRERDRLTPTEIEIGAMVREGRLPDPRETSLEAACRIERAGGKDAPAPVSAGGGLTAPRR